MAEKPSIRPLPVGRPIRKREPLCSGRSEIHHEEALPVLWKKTRRKLSAEKLANIKEGRRLSQWTEEDLEPAVGDKGEERKGLVLARPATLPPEGPSGGSAIRAGERQRL